MALKQFIVFNLCGQSFGIDISRIVQIINPSEIFKIPDTPDFVEGLINLRGNVYTVFNMHKRLGINSSSQQDNNKIIIVSTNTAAVGLMVDEVNEISAFEDEDFVNEDVLLSHYDSKYVSKVVKKDSKVILILNLDQITSVK